MNKFLILSCIVCLITGTYAQNKSWDRYKKLLFDRMHKQNINYGVLFPHISYDSELPANARYRNDTIWLGTIQRDYHTLDDTLSLIYHEFLHKVYEEGDKFKVGLDSTGNPLQWETDTFYTYQPLSIQVERDVENLVNYYRRVSPEWSEEELELQIQPLRELLSSPRTVPFRYAPSNLALEEIEAYRAQLKGEELRLYRLSPEAKRTLSIRLNQLDQTYQLRRSYENRNKLGRDGKQKKLAQRAITTKEY